MGATAQAQRQTPDAVLLQRAPQTLDEYAAYVQNRIQVAAMQLRQQGTADLRLTINRDGTIRQADIVDLEGPSALRDQVRPLVNQLSPLPPLPGNTDTLVVDTTVAFDYPGENILDRFGYLPQAGS
jgi:TonB family protein